MTKSEILLRVGLGFVFLYAGISALLNPLLWLGFFPDFIAKAKSAGLYLGLFSVFQMALAVWIFWGRAVFYAALISVILLLGITLFNFKAMDIVFRDIGLIFAGLALIFIKQNN